MRLLLALFSITAAALFASSNVTATQEYVYTVYLSGDEVVPPVDTDAYGFIRIFFAPDFESADITVDVKGLSTTAVGSADIHEGRPGKNGPVVLNLSEGAFLTASKHVEFSDADLQALVDGDWYVSVKSTFNPEGEMRAQIVVPSVILGNTAPELTATPTPRPATPRPAVQPTAAPSRPAVGGGTVISPPDTGSAGLR